MPRTPINYANAIVYKICCKDINVVEIYVGSTTNFTKRKCGHKANCDNVKLKSYNYNVYQFIRNNGGWNNFEMIELEKVLNCADANTLKSRERYFLENLKASLNMTTPTRTKSEYYQDNKETMSLQNKIYKNNNKEKYKEYKHNYHLKNIEKISEYTKEYAIENKDKISEYKKEYAIENKDKISEYKKNYSIENKERIKQYMKE
jgi:hypothetical protein